MKCLRADTVLPFGHSGIRASFVIRISCFVIQSSFVIEPPCLAWNGPMSGEIGPSDRPPLPDFTFSGRPKAVFPQLAECGMPRSPSV
jgi:hypothetical protein